MIIKTFSELSLLNTFQERFNYLKLDGSVGIETFGFDRILNQKFYTSKEWKTIRDYVIARDNGYDLGSSEKILYGKILVHHMNPLTDKDILERSELLLNPEYLISTSLETHNALHYSNDDVLYTEPITRFEHDTIPWKKGK